jgi:hypothetical protein
VKAGDFNGVKESYRIFSTLEEEGIVNGFEQQWHLQLSGADVPRDSCCSVT